MPKKVSQNSKAVAANAKKEANKQVAESKRLQEEEKKIAEEWSQGAKGKSKKDDDLQKKAEAKARKDAAAKLLEEEEKAFGSKKPLMRQDKTAEKKTKAVEERQKEVQPVESFAAYNIDDALDLMESTARSGGSSKQSSLIEKHPERRAKAAYMEYEDRMLPILKKENPSLRLSQLKEMLWKMWQKAPENPFNQNVLAYNATQDAVADAIDSKKQEIQDRLRE